MSQRYRRTSHAVYELNYHFVWPVKYRKHIKSPKIRKFLEDLFPPIATSYGFEVIKQNIQEDHIHLFISAPPKFSPSEMVNILKSISSAKEVFKKFSEVKRELWGGQFWSDGYFVRGVGEKVTSQIIQRYIDYQRAEEIGRQQRLF